MKPSSPTPCAAWSTSSTPHSELLQLEESIRRRYGADGGQVLAQYDPGYVVRTAASPEHCFTAPAPTLSALAGRFDARYPVLWLMVQLAELADYCGGTQRLTPAQMRQCAQLIVHEFGDLSTTELLLFFHRFKLGTYGRFYGLQDPLILTAALCAFRGEQARVLCRLEQERQERERADGREGCITYEEYLRRREARKKTSFPEGEGGCRTTPALVYK